ncbi:MAG: EAL domain-containing protein [Leptospira sp.]|nr:EAL domain-containing protein [Leptospira sp.]
MAALLENQYDINPAFLNEAFFVPHFQPIINVTTRNVSGYEVLGRLFSPTQGNYISLGAYFHGIDEDMLSVYNIDRIIREKAFRYLKDSLIKTKLFFNIMPHFLSRVHKSDLKAERFHVIQLIEKYGIDKKDIVLEITEDEFEGSIENLIQMVNVFREYGLTIAIDDLGVGFSNLERIGYLHPDIIKVDIKIMRESLNKNSFKQVLTAVSEMSQKLGSHLLFEGIETEEELNLALSMGGSLLQGYYFARPDSNFLNKNYFAKQLKATLEQFSGIRFLELTKNLDKEEILIESLDGIFTQHGIKYSDKTNKENFLPGVLKYLPHQITKVFLCDINGYQITPTYLKNEYNNFEERLSGLGNNYAWKPYFTKHKALAHKDRRRWNITTPLYDIRSQTEYVVFTYSLDAETILVSRVEW